MRIWVFVDDYLLAGESEEATVEACRISIHNRPINRDPCRELLVISEGVHFGQQ